jgi:tetratricopeptide (TPR) repeat protein
MSAAVQYLRQTLLVILTGMTIQVSAINCIDSLHSVLSSGKNIEDRLQLQALLLDHRDRGVEEQVHQTLLMDLSDEERFTCLYQLAYYHYRLTRNPDSLAYWVGQMSKYQFRGKLQVSLTKQMSAELHFLKNRDFLTRYTMYQNTSEYFLSKIASDDELDYHLRFLYTMARYARYEEFYDSAFVFLEKANTYLSRCKNDVLIYHVKREQASLYHVLEEDGTALDLLQESYALVTKHQVNYDLAYYHFYLGKSLATLRESEDALEQFALCEELSETFHIPDFLGGTYINQGVEYSRLGNFNKAEERYLKALDWYQKGRKQSQQKSMAVFINFANLNLKRGDYDRAMNDLQTVLDYAIQSGRTEYISAAHANMSAVLYEMGLLDSALLENTKAEKLLGRYEKNRLLSVLNTRHKVYLAKGNYKDAHDVLLKLQQIDDELFAEEEHKQVVKSRVLLRQQSYKNQLLQSELTLQKKEDEQKLGLIVFVAVLLILAMIFLVYYLRSISRRQKTNLEISGLRERYSKTQLEALRSQINPHFIFNSLNTFQYFLRKKENKKALDYLETFSGLLRETISVSGEEFIPVSKEIELIKDYIEIEMLRVSSEIDIRINSESLEEPKRLGIPPMLIQPLLENAIWHGAGRVKKGVISLTFHQSEYLYVAIQDNGPGYDMGDASLTRHKSYGIENVRKRLRNIGALHRVEASLSIVNLSNSGGRGTKQTIRLPIIKINE